MPVLQSFPGTNATGLTKVETEGTVTANVSQLTKNWLQSTGNDNSAWDQLGAFAAVGVAGAVGQVIYFDTNVSAIDTTGNFRVMIRNSAAITNTANTGQGILYFGGNGNNTFRAADCGEVGGSEPNIANLTTTILNVRGVIANGTVAWYYHVEDGTLPWAIAELSWVSAGDVTNAYNASTTTNYFAFNTFATSAAYADYVKRIVLTNDGTVTPQAPDDLAASATGETTIDLTFDDNGTAASETGIAIERSLSSGSGFSEIATVLQGIETYGDTGLTAATTYYYKIRSFWTFLGVTTYSAYSSEASATTDTPPVTSTPGEDALMVDILDGG